MRDGLIRNVLIRTAGVGIAVGVLFAGIPAHAVQAVAPEGTVATLTSSTPDDPETCFWQSGSGTPVGIGSAAFTTTSPSATFETLSPCSTPVAQPFSTYTGISSAFGLRVHPITGLTTMHYGTDYARSGIRGTPIRSIAPGTVASVITSYATSGTGNSIVIDHPGGFRSQYMHMEAPSSLAVGARVEIGQVVGFVGSTGGSTGAHLHLEIRVNGTHVNPAQYLATAPYLR